MKQLSDADLDRLLASVRRRTDVAAPAVREQLRFALAQRSPDRLTRALGLATLATAAVLLASVVVPLMGGALVSAWWVLPVAGGAWAATRRFA